MRTVRILNLGAGVQSTAVLLLSREGQLPPFDAAIFADTQEEPEAVYRHLEWLKSLDGLPPILTGTIGRLGDHLISGTNGAGGRKKHKAGMDGSTRFASIPAFTATHHDKRDPPGRLLSSCEIGRVLRQCTYEYKIEVVERIIRREVLGLKPRGRVPKGTTVEQYFGISYDEKGRAVRIKERNASRVPWSRPVFPLITLGWTRDECRRYLAGRVPHEVSRSACVFCPYKSWSEWLALKTRDPVGFARAVQIDDALRSEESRMAQGLNQSLYLVRKCIPLEMVDLEEEARKEAAKKPPPDMFAQFDCGEGMCGN